MAGQNEQIVTATPSSVFGQSTYGLLTFGWTHADRAFDVIRDSYIDKSLALDSQVDQTISLNSKVDNLILY
jgi:hypothetical protein